MSTLYEHVPKVDASRFSPELQAAKRLRDQSGYPLVECRQAMREANGDPEMAFELLPAIRRRPRSYTSRGCFQIAGYGWVIVVDHKFSTSPAKLIGKTVTIDGYDHRVRGVEYTGSAIDGRTKTIGLLIAGIPHPDLLGTGRSADVEDR